ncbi:aminopeptidase P family protein [Candidatus Bathyarchaeota archaeon]|nr:MAG: aminopeptidase P family protein [Candidatus Bathyarchaeota archaeon]
MRVNRLIESLERTDLDAYIVSREPNIYYYAGTISGGVLVAAPGAEPLLLAPRLNLAIAQAQAQGCRVKPYTRSNLLGELVDALKPLDPQTIGFDSLTLDLHRKLGERLNGVELKASADLVWSMRRVKDAGEQELMRKAGELADLGIAAIQEHLREGMREYEVAAEAAYAMMRSGAEDLAFSTIVASGPRSAYPHAGVTDRRIRRGDFVTIDLGATYKGYRSDITRTFIMGEPTEEQVKIYETVLRANQTALPEIKVGARGREVDQVARSIIEEAGYGEHFVHSLGHGVGLEVHEPPSLSRTSEDTLEPGNVVTDEPGIYIPGFGGVRIEDTVLVTDSGPERLTRFDKDLDAMRV